MFSLSVRSLDGTDVPVNVNYNSTLADVRAQLEASKHLRPLHEIKLFQGAKELADDDVLQVTLQAVSTVSQRQAVEELIGSVYGAQDNVRVSIRIAVRA